MSSRSHQIKLALVLMGVLLLIWIIQPYVSAFLGSDQNLNSNKGLYKIENQAERPLIDTPAYNTIPLPGVDPFKAHIEKNGFSNQTLEQNSASTAIKPADSGADPFKDFLEQQKRQSKEAGVSPFGR